MLYMFYAVYKRESKINILCLMVCNTVEESLHIWTGSVIKDVQFYELLLGNFIETIYHSVRFNNGSLLCL
jgi:hypothetical protein